jgi:hypothetical protein
MDVEVGNSLSGRLTLVEAHVKSVGSELLRKQGSGPADTVKHRSLLGRL